MLWFNVLLALLASDVHAHDPVCNFRVVWGTRDFSSD